MDYKAGMFLYAVAFLLGDIVVQQLSMLPSVAVLVTMVLSACLLCVVFVVMSKARKNGGFCQELTLIIVFILLFLFGFIYASLYAKQHISKKLDDSLIG